MDKTVGGLHRRQGWLARLGTSKVAAGVAHLLMVIDVAIQSAAAITALTTAPSPSPAVTVRCSKSRQTSSRFGLALPCLGGRFRGRGHRERRGVRLAPALGTRFTRSLSFIDIRHGFRTEVLNSGPKRGGDCRSTSVSETAVFEPPPDLSSCATGSASFLVATAASSRRAT
jgi:hypothetical protein